MKWQLLQVEIPEKLKDDLASEMKAAGIPEPDSEERWTMALEALKVHSPTLDSSVVPACDTVPVILYRSAACFCLQGT